MPSYSPSRIKAYENCPLQYKLNYIDKVEVEGGSIEAFMGNVVHEALLRLYKDIQTSKLDSLEDILKYYRAVWERDWDDEIEIVKEGLKPKNYFDTGQKCLTMYYNRFKPFDQGIPVWLERDVSFPLGGYTFRGKLDRLDKMADGSYEIHDYKTSGRVPSQETVDNDAQLAFYQMAVQHEWKDIKRIRLVWHYLQFDRDMFSARTEKQLEALKKETISLIDKIEAEKEFKPAPSPLCDWCGYWENCPEKRHLVKIAKMKPAKVRKEDGFVLVNKYAKLKAQASEIGEEMDEIKEQIIGYAQKMKVTKVRGSANVASVSIQKRLSLPSRSSDEEGYEKLVGIIKKAGLAEDFYLLDTSSLMRAISDEELEKQVIKTIKPFLSESKRIEVRMSSLIDEK